MTDAAAGGPRGDAPPDPKSFRYSVVIPVFNSADSVGEVIDRTIAMFEAEGLDHEIILVNDGSRDASWEVISEAAARLPSVTAINLLRNAGQHSANLCGFREATGDYVITIDDDLQNPPEEIPKLIATAMAGGHDVVYGRFEQKAASGVRTIGSRIIARINRQVFGQPRDLEVSNVRILRRDVVDRICQSRSSYPYITGQSLLYSRDRGSVVVRHEPRTVGRSNYNPFRIGSLVFRLLFSYTSFPLRVMAMVGMAMATLSFVIGGVALARAMLGESTVPGWPSLVVLISFFNGVMIAMLSMLGEYVVRTLNTVSATEPYIVTDRVTHA